MMGDGDKDEKGLVVSLALSGAVKAALGASYAQKDKVTKAQETLGLEEQRFAECLTHLRLVVGDSLRELNKIQRQLLDVVPEPTVATGERAIKVPEAAP